MTFEEVKKRILKEIINPFNKEAKSMGEATVSITIDKNKEDLGLGILKSKVKGTDLGKKLDKILKEYQSQ